jgi:O-antigen/teichoic acid export membrane protein
MSRTKRFVSGISFGYAGQLLTTFVGLWLTPFLLFRVGQHDYGLWLVGTQLMFYLALLDLGVVALLPRETACATGRASIEESAELPSLVGQTLRLVLWQMPLVALVATIAWFTIPNEWEGLRYPLGLVLLAFVLTFPLRIFGALLLGLQDLAFLGRLNIISFLISTAITVALVLTGWGLYALAFGWIVAQFIRAGSSWYRLRTQFPTVLPKGLPELRWPVTRSRLISGFWVSLNQIAQVLLNGTEILIIGKFFGPAAVVPYVCTGKLVGVLANQPQMLMASAGPALSQMRTGESRPRLAQVCIALAQAALLLSGAIVCIVLMVNQGFVIRWVGRDQYGGFWLTALLLLSMLMRHWNLTVGYTIFSFGYERRLCVTALLDGVLSIGAASLFVWLYGLIGAPLGMLVGVCLVSLPANLTALARESNMTVWELVKPLSAWFIRFIVLMFAAGALARTWTPNTIPLLVVTSAAGALIYLLVMFPLALRYPLGIYVRPRLFPLYSRMVRALRPRASV